MDGKVDVKLLFFAKGRELVGQKEATLELPSITTAKHILKCIVTSYPELSTISNNVLLSLNEDYLYGEEEVQLKSGDEIAVVPPISGG